jgi:hypothetical protein
MTAYILAAVVVGFAVVYAFAGVLLVRSRLRGRVREGHNDVLVPIFLTAGTLYAVLLAFLVIAVWESYGTAKETAADEASALTTMYRETNGLPDSEQRRLRGLVREYTEAVVTEEWSIQAATGGASPRARKALGEMYGAYKTMSPKVANSPIGVEFVQTLRTVAIDRDRRRLEASESLPGVLWAGLLIGALIVVGMTFALYMEEALPHVVFSILMAALIGTLLFIALVLNRPFVGPLALTPDSFEHAMSVYDSVDKGE